ncbi:MAG: hypothetical protein ACTSRG_23140 [Candidatus Helarchaeota archaeon]
MEEMGICTQCGEEFPIDELDDDGLCANCRWYPSFVDGLIL